MSEYGSYLYFDISSDSTLFEFTSNGPKGEIIKRVQFNKTNVDNIVILSFGNRMPDGSIDSMATDDNKDRNKILATVADVIYKFSTRYPETYVFFWGSTLDRTRLYRMSISINIETEFMKTFSIWGLTEEKRIMPFQKHQDYTGFLIKKKSNLNVSS